MDSFLSLFNQTSFDSGALSGSSVVVHKFSQAGPFQATILRADTALAQLNLEVILEQPAAGQPHLDLARLPSMGSQVAIQAAGEGYALFHAPTGDAGYAVAVQQAGGGETFDSRQLGPGDVFSAIVLRPGTYALVNAINATRGTITVPYPPAPGSTPYRPTDPQSVDCGAAGFTPSAISLEPMQGLVFHINTPARITIDLVTPDDGPGATQP